MKGIAQGTARNERIGNKVKFLNFRLSIWLRQNSNSTHATSNCRIVVVKAKQSLPDDNQDLLDAIGPVNWYSQMDLDNVHIKKDLNCNLSAMVHTIDNTSYASTNCKRIDINIKLNQTTQYDDDAQFVDTPLNKETCLIFMPNNRDVYMAYNYTAFYTDV